MLIRMARPFFGCPKTSIPEVPFSSACRFLPSRPLLPSDATLATFPSILVQIQRSTCSRSVSFDSTLSIFVSGTVNFLNATAAFSEGLAYVQDNGVVIMKGDNTTTLDEGVNRNRLVLNLLPRNDLLTNFGAVSEYPVTSNTILDFSS